MEEKKTRFEEQLSDADRAVFRAAGVASKDPHRPGYHAAAPGNWANDPNGLIHFRGEYHLFYQHHPFSAEWGPMHWGHMKSTDLVHWEHLPIALAPGEAYDRDGCFSGSAVEENGRMVLVYTGYVDGGNPKEVQCLAVSTDGITFVKHRANPVIDGPPADGSGDFRDPKVWKRGDTWYMVVGSGKDGRGKVLLYRSPDLIHWTYLGPVAESDGTQGAVWECPDLFSLGEGGEHVLIVSATDVEGPRNRYFVGEMDYETGRFVPRVSGALDYGFDFYAAQTFLDDSGRRIAIGWMDRWGSKTPTQRNGWAGMFSLPRELSLFPDGQLCVRPIPELQMLREEHCRYENLVLTPDSEGVPEGIRGDQLELIAEFRIDPGREAEEFGVLLRCSVDRAEQTRIAYRVKERTLFVDRNRSGTGDGGICEAPLAMLSDGTIKIHIFLDRSSVEVFGNEGRIAMSNRIYPDPSSLDVTLYVQGDPVTLVSLDVWKLRSIGPVAAACQGSGG